MIAEFRLQILDLRKKNSEALIYRDKQRKPKNIKIQN